MLTLEFRTVYNNIVLLYELHTLCIIRSVLYVSTFKIIFAKVCQYRTNSKTKDFPCLSHVNKRVRHLIIVQGYMPVALLIIIKYILIEHPQPESDGEEKQES